MPTYSTQRPRRLLSDIQMNQIPTEKRRILRVIARLNVGGPAIHTILLTDGLNNEQYETKLVSGREAEEEGNMHYLAQERGVDIHHFPYLQRELSLRDDLSALWHMWRLIRRYQPDLVHTHTAKAGFVGRAAVLLNRMLGGRRVRTVHTFHGHVFHGYFSPAKTKVFLLLEQFLARFSDTIITITPLQQQEILSLGIGTPRNHRLVPLGLDLERFYRQKRFSYLHEKFGISPEKRLIGTVARFTAIKNLPLFLKISQELLKNYTDIHFVMVGDGEDRPQLEALAQELGISEHVTFTGFIQETHLVYADLDIVMLTSKNEGSPVSIIEAMTSGVPVVASRVGGVPDLFEARAEELLCPSEDLQAFVKATRRLLDDPAFAGEVAALHKEKIYQQYSFRRLLSDITNIYQELLS